MGVYDWIIPNNQAPLIKEILKKNIFLYVVLFDRAITTGSFPIVGFEPLAQDEIDNIPPSFTQNLTDINKCVIFYYDGREYPATPQQCVGLERSAVWEDFGLVQRLEDYYVGRKNISVERKKPILSMEDPRYLTSPSMLSWDAKTEKFYKKDPI